MKRSMQEQIRCGGGSLEGMFFKAMKAAGITLAAFAAMSCAEAPKAVEPQTVEATVTYNHSTEDASITVESDNGQVATIGIRIDGSTQFTATIQSGDLDRTIIHNPDWKAGPQKKENIR